MTILNLKAKLQMAITFDKTPMHSLSVEINLILQIKADNFDFKVIGR
jgi:hypothetical protein